MLVQLADLGTGMEWKPYTAPKGLLTGAWHLSSFAGWDRLFQTSPIEGSVPHSPDVPVPQWCQVSLQPQPLCFVVSCHMYTQR